MRNHWVVKTMRRILIFAVSLVLMGLAPAVEQASAQSVLKIARGLKSNNVAVFIDRAVVLESTTRFTEVSVANPEIADVSPLSDRTIYIFGRRRGTTTLTLFGEGGRLVTNVTIKVEADHSELKKRLGQLLPGEPIEVRTANGGLILSGMVSGKAKIDRAMALARAYAGDAVANMMTVGGTQQVMLKVKIAEISRSAGKEIGISLGAEGGNGQVGVGAASGRAIREGAAGGGGFDQLVAAAGTFAGSFGAAFSVFNSFLVAVQIDALEQKGFARTLAEPNLVALSGAEAEFLAGGEVPVPVRGSDGEVTIQFKPVGVNLKFRPQVLDTNIINLNLSAEVTSVDTTLSSQTAGIDVVGFSVRRASTTVDLRDGQAFAIAGLLRQTFTDSVDQVPWLGDIPVLGTIFRSANYSRGESELVIIVSAHLVTPVDDESKLALPTDRISIPNEKELFLFGRTHEGGSTGEYTGAGFDGDYGYVVE